MGYSALSVNEHIELLYNHRFYANLLKNVPADKAEGILRNCNKELAAVEDVITDLTCAFASLTWEHVYTREQREQTMSNPEAQELYGQDSFTPEEMQEILDGVRWVLPDWHILNFTFCKK